MFLMRADSLRGQVGGSWALEIDSFLGPVKWHRADRRVRFGAQKCLAAIPSAVDVPSAVEVPSDVSVSGVPAVASAPALVLPDVACVPTLVNIPFFNRFWRPCY